MTDLGTFWQKAQFTFTYRLDFSRMDGAIEERHATRNSSFYKEQVSRGIWEQRVA